MSAIASALRRIARVFDRTAYDTSRSTCGAKAHTSSAPRAITCALRVKHDGPCQTAAGVRFVGRIGFAMCGESRDDNVCQLPLGHRCAHRVSIGNRLYEWTTE